MIKNLTIVLLFFMASTLKANSFDEKTVLILVDIQNDYFADGLLPLHNAEFAAANTAKLVYKFRNENIEVIHVQHTNTSGFFIANTFGQEIHGSVTPLETEMVFQKTQVSTFTNADFEPYLNQKGYENLIVCGMQTNVCVQALANDAVNKGFNVTIVEECCAAVDEITHSSTIKSLDADCVITNSLKIQSDVFNQPESIVYDSITETYFISNPGNGTVVKIDTSGVPILFKKDLGVPIGLVMLDSVLYIALQTKVEGYNMHTGIKTFELAIPEALGVNGLATDSDSLVFASDDTKNCIYQINIKNNTFETLVEDGLSFPNGLEYDENNNRLLICTSTGNRIVSYSFADKSVMELVAESYGSLDGLAIDENGNFYLSSWTKNSVYKFNSDFTTNIKVSEKHQGPADIFYNCKNGVLAIPNMSGNYIDLVKTNKNAAGWETADIQLLSTAEHIGNKEIADGKFNYGLKIGNYGIINDSVSIEITDFGSVNSSAITLSNNTSTISPFTSKSITLLIDPTLIEVGSHAVEITVTNKNSKSSSQIFTLKFKVVDNSTKIEITQGQGIRVFPNPAQNYITIETKEAQYLAIYNIKGKQIMGNIFASDKIKINVCHLKQGIYFVKTENQAVKFVKE